MSNLVHNERIKLLAGALNNLGVGGALAGTVLPLVNHPLINRPEGMFTLDNTYLFMSGYSMWVFFGLSAQWVMRFLVEQE
jgi:hypothetical protein